jgi:hypothetical protein
MPNTGKSLFNMYNNAGKTLLAHRLQHVFHPITTEADKALHNEILAEVLLIIDDKERTFMNGLTDLILYKRIPKQKRFLFHVATLILEIGHNQKG